MISILVLFMGPLKHVRTLLPGPSVCVSYLLRLKLSFFGVFTASSTMRSHLMDRDPGSVGT